MGHFCRAPRLIVDSVAAILAIVLLVSIAAWRRHRAAVAVDEDRYEGPEPTQAEVKAAEESIRAKTTQSVRRAKAQAVKSLVMFLALVLASVPFMAGMPLNSAFRPWGQLILFAAAIAFAWALLACSSFALALSYKKKAEKFLSSLHDTD